MLNKNIFDMKTRLFAMNSVPCPSCGKCLQFVTECSNVWCGGCHTTWRVSNGRIVGKL